jgi:hypothetical protein
MVSRNGFPPRRIVIGFIQAQVLRLTIPNDTANRGRWPEHPTWTVLRTGFALHAMAGAPLPEDKQELIRST